ncbi:MAG TPA: hypothetical protein VFU56_08625 [Gaiellaceae bacterium]|nr:hypothetical protein [Gaiellaceae bacterium]
MRRLAPLIVVVAALTIAATVLIAFVAATYASAGRSLAPFRGTGTWVSIYDGAALRHPEAVVRRLQAHGIHTIFLETSNDRQRRGVAHPVATARFLHAAHLAGIDVVGWYLPSFVSPRGDVRRALQGARFRSPEGDGFDAFALDIESTKVRSLRLRTARAVAFARAVRAALPPRLALGAITIDPVGATYWKGYPFRALARSVDIFLPMEYFTARTSGARRVAAYADANMRVVRRLAGDSRFPVHPIGGEARHASLAELRAFLHASRNEVGVSLWEYGETSGRQLKTLAAGR